MSEKDKESKKIDFTDPALILSIIDAVAIIGIGVYEHGRISDLEAKLNSGGKKIDAALNENKSGNEINKKAIESLIARVDTESKGTIAKLKKLEKENSEKDKLLKKYEARFNYLARLLKDNKITVTYPDTLNEKTTSSRSSKSKKVKKGKKVKYESDSDSDSDSEDEVTEKDLEALKKQD